MIKKFYYFLPALLMCLVSCEPKNGGPDVPQEVTADVTYHVSGGEDMLNLFDMSMKYTNKDNEIVTESVTTLPWDKVLSKVDVPRTASMELLLTPKTNYPDKATYKVGISLGVSYITTAGQSKYWSSSSVLSIPKDKVVAYQENTSATDHKASEEIE